MGNNKFKNIFRSEFVRNSSILISGNIVGQAVALLVYPILSRLYSKEIFGVYALFMSVMGILSILATCKYEEAIILANDKKEYLSITGFTIKLLTSFTILLWLILWLFRIPIFSLLKMESLNDYWYMIPLTVFFTGLFYILTSLATKRKMFKLTSSANISLNCFSSFFKLLTGYLSFPSGLIVSNLIAQFLSCFSFHKLKTEIKSAITGKWKEQKQAGIKYLDFPKYSMTRNLINAFSGNIPFLMLTSVFGEASLGLYSMAFMMGFRPITLVSSSLYQVFYEKTTSLKNEGKKILPYLKKFWINTSLSLLPLFIIAYFIAPPLFKFVFGAKWEQSGVYFGYLLPWIFIAVTTYPMAFIPALYSKQNKALWLEIACMLVRLIVIYIGIYFKSFELSIILYSMVSCIFSIISLLWYIYLIKTNENGNDNSQIS